MRIHFSIWGRGTNRLRHVAKYAMSSGGAPIWDVIRSLERSTGLRRCAGPSDEGTAISCGKPVAHHYKISLGEPCSCPGGGYTPRAEVWISIPTGGSK